MQLAHTPLMGGGTGAETDADYLSPELAQLLTSARHELDRHVNQDGTCPICDLAWPCEAACLAAFTLGEL